MSSTPEGAHQALDDDGLIRPGGVNATAGMLTESSAFALTHTSSVCKKVYVDNGNDKTTLYVLSIVGLVHDDQQPLLPLEQEPWSSFSRNTLRPPKNSDLVKEIRR